MNPVRFKVGGRRRRPGPSPNAVILKLAIMAAVFVAVLAVMLNPDLLYRAGLPREQPAATRPARPGGRMPTIRILTASQPASRPSATQPAKPPDAASRPTTGPVGLPLGIDRAILNDVDDLEDVETVPYFEALKAVRDLPEAAITQPGLPEVGLVDLVDRPETFRGRLVTIRGNLRRLTRQDLGVNAAGLDHVHVAQIRDPISAHYIYAAVLVEDPAPEVEVGREVAFTGVFFKLAVGRDATQTLRKSPLLMGRSVRVLEGEYTEQYKVPITLGAAVGLLLLFLMVVAVLLYRRGDRKFSRRLRLAGLRTPPSFGAEGPDEKTDGAGPEREESGHGDDQP